MHSSEVDKQVEDFVALVKKWRNRWLLPAVGLLMPVLAFVVVAPRLRNRVQLLLHRAESSRLISRDKMKEMVVGETEDEIIKLIGKPTFTEGTHEWGHFSYERWTWKKPLTYDFIPEYPDFQMTLLMKRDDSPPPEVAKDAPPEMKRPVPDTRGVWICVKIEFRGPPS
jgi:hypothetical protein